jgi:hypothetical protein
MKKQLYISFFLFFVFSIVVKAQKFETKSIEYIYELLGDRCALPQKTGLFNCNKLNFPLEIKYNTENEICHLGIVLFNDNYNDYFGEAICNFQERLFLSLCLLPDTKINEYCKENRLGLSVMELTGNKIIARKDIEQAINFIKQNDTRYIFVKDSLYCFSTWQNGSKKVELVFPSTFSLISGMDKKEADDLFEKEMNRLPSPESIPNTLFVDRQDLYETDNDVFVKYGKTMFIKNMNSNLYFTHTEGQGYSLLYNRMSPLESISNLIIFPDKNTQRLSIHIKHKAYGGEIKEYDTNFFDFLTFLNHDYNTYIGIEKLTNNVLNFTIIFQNKYFNCYHLLYIETSPNVIFNAEKYLEGTLYTYIPNHNIKDLYKKYIEN